VVTGKPLDIWSIIQDKRFEDQPFGLQSRHLHPLA